LCLTHKFYIFFFQFAGEMSNSIGDSWVRGKSIRPTTCWSVNFVMSVMYIVCISEYIV
jgi:hypothetical protein